MWLCPIWTTNFAVQIGVFPQSQKKLSVFQPTFSPPCKRAIGGYRHFAQSNHHQRHDWGQPALAVESNPPSASNHDAGATNGTTGGNLSSVWGYTHHWPVSTMQGNQRHNWGQSVLGVGCNPSSASKHNAGAINGTTGGNPLSASKHDAGGNLPSLWRATHHRPVSRCRATNGTTGGNQSSVSGTIHHQPVSTMQGNQRHNWVFFTLNRYTFISV